MIFKLLGTVLISVCGAFIGYALVEELRKKEKILEEYGFLLGTVKHLAENNHSTKEIWNHLTGSHYGFELLQLESWPNLREYRLPEELPIKDRLYLECIFSRIGALQPDLLVAELEQYRLDAQNIADKYKECICKAEQLYTKTGALFGLAIAIILW